MSKNFIVFLGIPVILCAAFLSACSGTSTGTQSAGAGRSSSGAGGTNPLPPVSEYLVGTFKLEGTDNAVDANMAAALIPPYQVLKELSGNNSTAQAEIDSVSDQIKSAMTPAQVQAISDMKLTQQDLFGLMQQLGQGGNRTGAARTPGAGGFNGGGGPPGGFGGGGGGITGGGNSTTNTNQSATIAAARTQQAKAARLPSTALLDAIIHLLQQRAGMATDTPNGSVTPAADFPAATNTPAP
jgi:hypothetical protein